MEEEAHRIEKRAIPILHFSVQFQNVFVAEIIAKHFPVDASIYNPSDLETTMVLEGISVDTTTSIAQAILSIQVLLKSEPRLFEIADPMMRNPSIRANNTSITRSLPTMLKR